VRLSEKGRSIGLLTEDAYDRFRQRKARVEAESARLKRVTLSPLNAEANRGLETLGTPPLKDGATLEQILKRPEVEYSFIERFSPPEEPLSAAEKQRVQIEIKYEGYIARQCASAEKLMKSEAMRIPPGFDYKGVSGISSEVAEKLEAVRPENMGQAGRIPGVTPAALTLILLNVEKLRRSGG
jgi:tRNA uridine 5-carboxymethylaminomethyl modification enzyme